MIELAGGKYIFENLGDSETKRSTVNMQLEEFYNGAKDADFLIYNITDNLIQKKALVEKKDVIQEISKVNRNKQVKELV